MKQRYKYLAAFIALILVLPFILTGCLGDGEPKETVSIPSSEIAVLTPPAFEHNVTDENLKAAISAHSEGGINVNIKKGETFSFKLGESFSVKNYSVVRLAAVDKYDPDAELSSYTDIFVPLEYDRASGLFSLQSDWWYSSTGWVAENDVWSVLIEVSDESGNKYFYYFRMIFAEDTEA